MTQRDFSIILFDDFETLDALGPAEIIGRLPEQYRLGCYSPAGGPVQSSQNINVITRPFAEIPSGGVLLIPGGMGTRSLINNPVYIGALHDLCATSEFVLTVCTGTALIAQTAFMDGRKATTNKKAFGWVTSLSDRVDWQPSARWVTDGNLYSSSGVSAGMDMTLGFIADRHGQELAEEVARSIEYLWNSDKNNDPFAL